MLAQVQHDIEAIDAPDQSLSLKPPHPDHWHLHRACSRALHSKFVSIPDHSGPRRSQRRKPRRFLRNASKKLSRSVLVKDADANAGHVDSLDSINSCQIYHKAMTLNSW